MFWDLIKDKNDKDWHTFKFFCSPFQKPTKGVLKDIVIPKVIKPNKFRCFKICSNHETMLPLIKSENGINQQKVSIPQFFFYANFFIKAPKFPGFWFLFNLKENNFVLYCMYHSMEGYLKIKQSFNRKYL